MTNPAASAPSSGTSTITFPNGVSLVDVSIAVGPAGAGLRHAAPAPFAAAHPAARQAATVQCVGNTCSYSVPPASTVAITLHIELATGARSGNLVLRTSGAATAVAITVRQPVTSSAEPATTPATTVGTPTDTAAPPGTESAAVDPPSPDTSGTPSPT